MSDQRYLAYLMGDTTPFRREFDEIIERESGAELMSALGGRADILSETGNIDGARVDFDRGVELLRHIVNQPSVPVPAICGFLDRICQVARKTGDNRYADLVEPIATAIHENRLPEEFPYLPWRRHHQERALACLALICVTRRAESVAKSLCDRVEAITRRTPIDDHLRGLLAHTAGRLDIGASHFEDSLKFNRDAGYRPDVAWGCCDFADLLADRAKPGDFDHAKELLDEGLNIASELDMVTLKTRIGDRQKHLTALPAPAASAGHGASFPDGLTAREVEVLRFVAKGFTNNEIAEFLHISGRTVATHLRNVYEKVGCANRAEASAYAIREGLAEE